MARGKSITKLLLDSSQAALFAGIEIHNKPHIAFRYPTTTILVINAWELALKAYIYKYIGKRKIYEKGSNHTIAFAKALSEVREHINSNEKNKRFNAVYNNLLLLNEYRNSNVHFVEGKLDPIIFMLITKSILNYDNFLKKYFNKDITKDDNLIILPVGMKLPFDPIDYLKQDYGNAHNDFVNSVVQVVRELDKDGVQDSIVVGFNVFADRVRDQKNADIIAAIERSPDAVKFRKTFRVTDDPNAPAIRVEPELPPLRYHDLLKLVKEKDPSIKQGKNYNEAMKIIKKDHKYCTPRLLDPSNKTGTRKEFYTMDAVDALIEVYHNIVNNKE